MQVLSYFENAKMISAAVNWKNFDDDDDSWGTFTSCINPPLSGSIRRTDDSGYGPRHNVHMRGVPFRATEEDIFEVFFCLRIS